MQADSRLQAFAAKCLEGFDFFRAPLSAADRERRTNSQLTRRQLELLDRWGYPYVLDEYRFHMTLTGPLPKQERDFFRFNLERAFADRAGEAVELDAISVMKQDNSASTLSRASPVSVAALNAALS